MTGLRGGWRPAVLVSIVGLSCLAAPAVATVTAGPGAHPRLAEGQLGQVDLSMRVLDRGSRSADRGALASGQPASPVSSGAGNAADDPEVPHPLLRVRPVAVAAPAPAPAPVAAPAPTATVAVPAPTATPAPKATAPRAPKATATPAPTTTAVAAPAPAAGGISGAPCAGGSAVESGLTPDAIRVHRAVCALFPSVRAYGGRSGSGGEHGSGHAVDIMIPSGGVGSQIAAWVRANATALGVSEVIWSQHIWTVQRSSEGWRAMSDRGSATANHYDHVHVTVYGSSGS
ncbi:hypothetical protein [Lapillicoccus sp.]|uniref:hypothetical protein n=1 Tax=Lapillicoccus sp. TaxID=1909287 RepID=UPI0032667010